MNLDATTLESLGRLKRMVWLRYRTEIEQTLFSLGMVGIVLSCLLLMQATVGMTSRGGRHIPPTPELIPYASLGLAVSVALSATRVLVRNYTLLDPERQYLFHTSDSSGFAGFAS
jgi:hypothetical protein